MTHNPSHSISHSTDHPIEPWKLTAYALNELEAADAIRVEQAIEAVPSLRIELEQIQRTLASVRIALTKSSSQVKLDAERTTTITDQIEQIVAPNSIVTVSTMKLAQRPFYRRKRFAALLATAAAIPLAANWGPSLFEKGSTVAYRMNSIGEPSPSPSKEVTAFTASTEIVRNQDPSSAPASLGNRLNPSGTLELAVSPPDASRNSEDRPTLVASSDAVNAESGLIGDVEISFVPEVGVVTLKGNQRDLERVKNGIDGIKDKLYVESSTAPISTKPEAEKQAGEKHVGEKQTADKHVGEKLADSYELMNSNASAITPRGSDVAVQSGDYPGVPSETSAAGLGGGGGYGGGGYEGGGYGEAGYGGSMGGGGGLAGGMGRGGMGGLPGSYATPSSDVTGRSADGYGATEKSGGMAGSYGSEKGNAGKAATEGSQTPYGVWGTRAATPQGPSPTTATMPQLSLAQTTAAFDKREDNRGFSTDLPEELRANIRRFRSIGQDNKGTDRFEKIFETPFVEAQKAPLSTFSIDVDTASYSKIRQTLMEGNRLPSPSMVRIEEMVNYFEYEYAGPQEGRPFASHLIVDRCPWNAEHQLVRVGLQAKKIDTQSRGKANIVFLLDVSGSMNEPNKLPLVKKSLAMMVNQLTENDRVAIVVYAGAAGCVLPSTCGIDKQRILSALDHLEAGGSTNGGQGIQLAYSIARDHFVPGGANRVVLCTDGDFNVGVTGDDALVAMMQENAKSNIFLTCLGFGAGNYNDTMMEKISNKGNGVYGMIDNELEGRRMMVEQLGGTLVTVAKDVKIQVDFNSAKVAGYRLIGYEDRRLANRDFSDDKKDAGEIGAGHRVTALYEVIPAGKWVGAKNASDGEVSKYAKKPEPKIEAPAAGENSSEVLTLRVRYKEPEGSESTLQEFVLKESDENNRPLVDRDMRWATAVAEFGLLLRRSEMAPNANWSDMLERATNSAGGDPYRLECLTMMRRAMGMMR